MNKKIIITSDPFETRAVVIEDDIPCEFISQKKSNTSLLTNVYKGVVSRILPGMNCAFIDIGYEKSGFLYGGDVLTSKSINASFNQQNKSSQNGNIKKDEHKKDGSKNNIPIERLLDQGQQILCQVIKEPLGTKGPRISMGPKIPGRYLVLMPDYRHIAVSRRIDDDKERERLTALVGSHVNLNECGFIIRTAATEASESELIIDIKYLLAVWKKISAKISESSAPSLLYSDVSLPEKIVRDVYSEDVNQIICDSETDYNAVYDFISAAMPGSTSKLSLYTGEESLFESYGLNKKIEDSLSKKAPLPSGGSLVIEQTEALTTVDINTGSFVGKKNARQTLLKTNLEAIPVIVNELRFRNIGGIIVIDFIDMDEISDREIVYNALVEHFKKDRSRTNILRMSDLGLVQMTRKRTDESITRKLTVSCTSCLGTGRIKNNETQTFDLIRELLKRFHTTSQRDFTVTLTKNIHEHILGLLKSSFDALISSENIQINFKLSDSSTFDDQNCSWSVESTVKI